MKISNGIFIVAISFVLAGGQSRADAPAGAAGQASKGASNELDHEGVATASIFLLSKQDMPALRRAALGGDRVAAERLFHHFYAMDPQRFLRGGDSSSGKKNRREAEFWMRIAAENGSVDAMQSYSLELLESRSSANCIRAQFWMKKARQLKGDSSPSDVPTC